MFTNDFSLRQSLLGVRWPAVIPALLLLVVVTVLVSYPLQGWFIWRSGDDIPWWYLIVSALMILGLPLGCVVRYCRAGWLLGLLRLRFWCSPNGN